MCVCVGRDLFFAALFFCSALLWSDLCRSLPECFALTCLLSLVCLHRLLVCSPAWPLPVALVVKLSNFVCLKQEGAGLVAGEESAGPINCLTLDSHGIFVGVGGVNGLVGVVGRLPCRPRAGVVSLSICVSRSLCVALSLSLFLFLVLPLALSLCFSLSIMALSLAAVQVVGAAAGWDLQPHRRCGAPPSSADTCAVRCRAGIGFSNA